MVSDSLCSSFEHKIKKKVRDKQGLNINNMLHATNDVFTPEGEGDNIE